MKSGEPRGVLGGHEVMSRAEELAGLEVETAQVEAEIDHAERVDLVLRLPHESGGIAHTIIMMMVMRVKAIVLSPPPLKMEEAMDESMALNTQLEEFIGGVYADTSSPEVHISR